MSVIAPVTSWIPFEVVSVPSNAVGPASLFVSTPAGRLVGLIEEVNALPGTFVSPAPLPEIVPLVLAMFPAVRVPTATVKPLLRTTGDVSPLVRATGGKLVWFSGVSVKRVMTGAPCAFVVTVITLVPLVGVVAAVGKR